jgi:hypothetical protein
MLKCDTPFPRDKNYCEYVDKLPDSFTNVNFISTSSKTRKIYAQSDRCSINDTVSTEVINIDIANLIDQFKRESLRPVRDDSWPTVYVRCDLLLKKGEEEIKNLYVPPVIKDKEYKPLHFKAIKCEHDEVSSYEFPNRSEKRKD